MCRCAIRDIVRASSNEMAYESDDDDGDYNDDDVPPHFEAFATLEKCLRLFQQIE